MSVRALSNATVLRKALLFISSFSRHAVRVQIPTSEVPRLPSEIRYLPIAVPQDWVELQ
jgi:hypothetical protein